jgi:hypothetical protein
VFVMKGCALEMICLRMNSAVIDVVREDFLDGCGIPGGWMWNLLSVMVFQMLFVGECSVVVM